MPQQLPPSLMTVPNPPFSNLSRTPQIIALNASAAQPSPWPYVYLDNTTGAQPYGPPTPVPPPSPVVITQTPYANQWMATVIQSWQPTWPYVYFDPTEGAQPYGPPTPQPQQFVPYIPYVPTWLSGVLQSWQAPIPQPQRPNYSNATNIINNPPFPGAFKFQPPYPDPFVAPTQSRPAVVQQNIIPSTTIPYSIAWMSGVVRAWFPEPPAPILQRYCNVADLVVPAPPVVGNSNYWLLPVVESWITPPPAPILPTYSNPANLVVPNPPVIGAYRWQPPYPDTYIPPQPSHYQPPPTAAVVVTQSPYSNAWLATVIQAWQPVDQRPQQPKPGNPSYFANLPPPILPVPVWTTATGLFQHGYSLIFPKAVGSNVTGVQPPVPPTPPPPSTSEYTVSGPDVVTYLEEVFYDVTYELGEVEKETT
jgi:hypothetical protein